MNKIALKFFTRKKVALGLGAILLLGIILEIWLVNRLSTYGEQISRLEKTALDLQLENQILKNQIDQKKSIQFVAKQAKDLGFDRSYSIEYFNPESPVLSSR